MKVPDDRLLTKKEVAYYLKINARGVERLVSAGKLRCIKVMRSARFNPEQVRWIMENGVTL